MKKSGKILIVDDIADNRKLLAMLLKIHVKKETISMESGEILLENLDIFEKEDIDIILLDVMMPKVSGFQVAEILKNNEKTKNIPIIFITALDNSESKIEAFKRGGVDYISKPFNKDELIARINVQIKLKKLNDKLTAVNNKMNREFEFAKKIHKKIIDFREPKLEKFKLKIKNFSVGGIGGDFIDSVDLSDGRKGIIFADVSGHGIAAALMVSALKFIISTYFKDMLYPSEALYLLNDMINDTFIGEGITLSVVYFIVDEELDKITLCCCSQEDVILLKDNKVSKVEDKSLILGVLSTDMIYDNDELVFKDVEIKLDKNDKLILFTDGLVENELMDRNDLLEELDKLKNENIDVISDKFASFFEGENKSVPKDDTTYLLLEKV